MIMILQTQPPQIPNQHQNVEGPLMIPTPTPHHHHLQQHEHNHMFYPIKLII